MSSPGSVSPSSSLMIQEQIYPTEYSFHFKRQQHSGYQSVLCYGDSVDIKEILEKLARLATNQLCRIKCEFHSVDITINKNCRILFDNLARDGTGFTKVARDVVELLKTVPLESWE